MSRPDTTQESYTNRLQSLQQPRWKQWLDVQRPYRWNLRRLNPGRTLDVGCGIGRCLRALPSGSVGIDHNTHSVAAVRALGLPAFSPEDFQQSAFCREAHFDTLLFAHVLEHLPRAAGVALVRSYLPLLRTGGSVVLICPQERGFASDRTHLVFLESADLCEILHEVGIKVTKRFSFPFPRFVGKLFTYNESIVVGVNS